MPFLASPVLAQQYPFWTQYRSNQFMLNPAVAGTRKTLDARINYRNQWVGFEGAPKTMGASVHGSFFKDGTMGAGGFVYRDQIGPSLITSVALAYAYHLRFEDTQLSFGVNGSYNSQTLDPGKITYHNNQDNAILSSMTYTRARIPNAAIGALFFGERFHVGVSVNNLLGTTYEFPKKETVKRKGHITTTQHYALSLGYNWLYNPDYIWESNLYANFVPGAPLLLDYSLRLHMLDGFFAGAGIRLKTAVYAQVGYTFRQTFQVSYTYDFNTNALRATNTGSHEIKLAYCFDNTTNTSHGNRAFQRRHYHLM